MERLLIIFPIPQAGMSVILSIITWSIKVLRHDGLYYQLVETNLHTWKNDFSSIKSTVFSKPKHTPSRRISAVEVMIHALLICIVDLGEWLKLRPPPHAFHPGRLELSRGKFGLHSGQAKNEYGLCGFQVGLLLSHRTFVTHPSVITYTKPDNEKRETTDRIQVNNWWERRTAGREEGAARQKRGGEFGLILYLIRL
jgi:hypothetical protein